MALISDTIMNTALNYLKANGDALNLCDTLPTTYTEAITTYMLATASITSTDYTGPADGDTSGRKITVDAQSSISVTNSGDTAYAAITDSGNSELLLVAVCTAQTLTSGNTVNTTAFDWEIRDAADE